MNLKTMVAPAISLGVATLFAACGGGGGSGNGTVVNTPAPIVGSAQGAYIGTVSDGREHDTIVLENDQFYTMYGHTIGAAFVVEGFLQGNGKSNNGNFSAPDVVDSTANNLRIPATLTATYTPGVNLNGTLAENSSAVSFTSTPIASAVFNYNTAANLSDLVGKWDLTSLRGFSNSFTIDSTGAFLATSSGCTFAGNFVPRASGKNIFDVSMSFGPAPCVLAGQSIKGIAIDYVLTNGKRQLIVAGIDQSRTNTAAFFGVR
jgi:hypothetical protein